MKPKPLIVASLLTLGLVPVLWWAWRKFTRIEPESLSPEWLHQIHPFDRTGDEP